MGTLAKIACPPVSSSIGIATHGNVDETEGKSTFYDHITFGRITKLKTTVLVPDGADNDPLRYFTQVANKALHTTFHGHTDNHTVLIPPVKPGSFYDGLLVIPGAPRSKQGDPVRASYENRLIKEALLRGQPMLAICAGSWRLWEFLWRQFIGEVELLDCIEEVYGHSAPKMMSLSPNAPIVQDNTLLHGLQLGTESLVYSFMHAKPGDLSQSQNPHSPYRLIPPAPINMKTNSVHQHAPKVPTITNPSLQDRFKLGKHLIEIAAKSSSSDPDIQSGSIEAFCLRFGAPVVGMQWHPEAFVPDHDEKDDERLKAAQYNQAFITNMAKAGQAYAAKRLLLSQFNHIYHHSPC